MDDMLVMDKEYGYEGLKYAEQDGEKWFIADDICRLIGISSPTMAVQAVEDNDKGFCMVDAMPKPGMRMVVNESGLKKILWYFRTRKSNAFRVWMNTKRKNTDDSVASNEEKTHADHEPQGITVREYAVIHHEPVIESENEPKHENQFFEFNNPLFGNVRVIQKDGEPWFVAKDVCRALEIGNPSQALARLDNDEKFTTIISNESAATGKSNMSFVNEPGLYALVLGSRKPEAKAFKRWITHEVIPSIRKYGMYATDGIIDKMIDDPDFGIHLLSKLKDERERSHKLAIKNQELEQDNNAMRPKAEYCDRVLDSESLITTTAIAKDFGMSAYQLNKFLYEQHIQYRSKDNMRWYLYQKYAALGYAKSRTGFDANGNSFTNLVWTEKGRKFIYELLASKGIHPVNVNINKTPA